MDFITLIAVPTGGQLPGLRRLLNVLVSEYGSRQDVRLLVVDNSATASAREPFEECVSAFEDRARYVYEPQRGYSNVRNAVIRNIGDVSAVAMIDDDEVPSPGWLDNLLAAQGRFGADIVAGSVVREFPPDVPTWYAQSRVLDLEILDLPEGSVMPCCASHNTLVLPRVFQLVPEGFHPKFNRMGGEDTHFFTLAQRRGCSIVWTHTAAVHELRSPDCFTRRWIFQRAVRSGNSRAIVEFELASSPYARLARACKMLGLGCFGMGSAIVAGISRDRALGLRALHRVGRAYGMALAFKSLEPWAP